MDQETGSKTNPESRTYRLVRKIIGRVDRGGELSPTLRAVLKRLGEQSESDVAVDAGREEGFEVDRKALREDPESKK